MSVPGFTAERALYGRGPTRFAGAGAARARDASARVEPALNCRQALEACKNTCNTTYSDPKQRGFCLSTCDFGFVTCKILTLGLA